MKKRVMYIISLVLVMVAAGIALSHIIHFSGKAALTPQAFLNVQQKFYENYGVVTGGFQFGAFIMLLVLLAITPAKSPRRPFFVVSLVAIAIMASVWIFKINPMDLQIHSATSVKEFPEIVDIRKQWAMWQGIRGVAGLLGVVSIAYAFILGDKAKAELQSSQA
ncbi:MAG: hypothetical protein GF401_02745 [Chitinivibrionales bacterium]|nr:hypothetical protein [Chitinivibrionales bacterium]